MTENAGARLVIVGLGLIGASLAKAVKHSGIYRHVAGVDTDPDTCRQALELGLVDSAGSDLLAAAEQADILVLSVPVLASEQILRQLAGARLADKLVITDVGSVKGSFVEAARRVFGQLPPTLVPGHPIAGSERSGVGAADAQLFRHHKVILTPHADGCEQALQQIIKLWQAAGAEVECMDVEEHDLVLAATSHLPH